MNFWDNFWPGFAATVAGVVLGIPAALWLERLIEARAERKADDAEKQRLGSTVTAVSSSLAVNATALIAIKESLQKGQIPLAPNFDSATWRVLRGELRTLSDRQLLSDLAILFNRIEEIRRLLVVYEQQFFTTQASMSSVGKLRTQLVEVIVKMCEAAHKETTRLTDALKSI